MNITIKNVKYNAALSEETHCFSATVYIDGKRSFGAKNAGHGGDDDYYPLDDKLTNKEVWDMVANIDAELGEEKFMFHGVELSNSLDMVIGDLMNQYHLDKHIKKELKRICYLKDNKVYVSNNLPTPLMIDRIKSAHWWKQEYKILNGLPIEEVRQYFE